MNISKAELKGLRSLASKKTREGEGKFLLEGWRALGECIDANAKPLVTVFDPDRAGPEQLNLLERLRRMNVSVRAITGKDLESIAETVHTQGVLAVLPVRRLKWEGTVAGSVRVIVMLDRVSDPGNLGTILRTCDWFGVSTIVLGKGCVSLYNEKVVRSTVGSLLRLNVYEQVDLVPAVDRLRGAGFQIASTSMKGTDVHSLRKPPGRSVLLFGSEAHGIDKNLVDRADIRISIPKIGAGESLNVGVAVGILLSHWSRR